MTVRDTIHRVGISSSIILQFCTECRLMRRFLEIARARHRNWYFSKSPNWIRDVILGNVDGNWIISKPGGGGGGLFMIICQLFAIISSGIICFFMNYLDCGLFDGKYFIFWQDYLRLFEIIWDYRVCALFEIIWDYRRLVYINCRLFALDYLRLFETRIISKYLFGLFDNFLKCRLFEIIYISNWAFQKMNKAR